MVEPPEVIGSPPTRSKAVTVVVPTYNHEAFIEDCLDGILEQRFSQDYKIVVHDDASTDGTPDILRRYAREHPDLIQLVLQRRNQLSRGEPAAWLDPLMHPVTPYIAFCEGDDQWIDSVKLETQWRFMQRSPWCAISHHDVEISANANAFQYATELRHYLNVSVPSQERAPATSLVQGNWIMTCSVMLRSSALPSDLIAVIGNRHPRDFILFSLAADAGDIGLVLGVMSRYRLHGDNFWSGMAPEIRVNLEIETLWFLAAHLKGAARDLIRDRLLEILSGEPEERLRAPLRRLHRQADELVHDRQVLLERVRDLEATESRLTRLIEESRDE